MNVASGGFFRARGIGTLALLLTVVLPVQTHAQSSETTAIVYPEASTIDHLPTLAPTTRFVDHALSPPPTASIQAGRGIFNIDAFLQICPQDDLTYVAIRTDFTIRRNGTIVDAIPCKAPIFTAMGSADITDELLVAQTLRVIYYLDRDHPGSLPWTPNTFYDWLKGQIGGINIDDTATTSFCCTVIGGRRYIHTRAQTFGPPFPVSFLMGIPFISGRIALYGHEARHVDGFPHSSCCGVTNGCDGKYDVTNLSPYGMQYWIFAAFLDGTFDVGIACLDSKRQDEFAGDMARAANLYPSLFCSSPPPALLPVRLPPTQCGRRRAVRH